MSKICTYLMGTMDFDSPEILEIEVPIAHALSMLCRFGGHCIEFYSVAQHSILVAELLRDKGYGPRVQLLGLLHDAHEAYTGDVVTPLKRKLSGYEEIANKIQKQILQRYNLEADLSTSLAVKIADEEALDIEAYWLFGERFFLVSGRELPENPRDIFRLNRLQAKREFLRRLYKLTEEVVIDEG